MMISVRLLLRHLAAIVALPGTVAVAIPVWIAERNPLTFIAPHSLSGAALLVCGAALLAVGLALFGASVRYFWSRGRGTLAPWDPPRCFVVEGPYRFVRNPMVSGVMIVLLGEAFALRSRPHLTMGLKTHGRVQLPRPKIKIASVQKSRQKSRAIGNCTRP